MDLVNTQAAAENGIWVTNTPGATADAVADLTLGLMLCLLRHIPKMVSDLKKGNWNQIEGREMNAMTIGVVGLGSIGKAVAIRSLAFGAKVIAHDINPDDDFSRHCKVPYLPLDDLLGQADIVCLCVSLNDTTRGLMNRQRLDLLKKSAYLINVSRPAVVDKDYLVEKLRRNGIAGAAIDVHDPRPCPPDDPFLHLDNVIATPWVAYKTAESTVKMCNPAVRDVVSVLKGEKPRYPVNKPIGLAHTA